MSEDGRAMSLATSMSTWLDDAPPKQGMLFIIVTALVALFKTEGIENEQPPPVIQTYKEVGNLHEHKHADRQLHGPQHLSCKRASRSERV